MRADIEFYLDGTVEERLPLLTADDSHLIFKERNFDAYRLNPKHPALDHYFVYGITDDEIMSENQLHIEVQRALGFQAGSNLGYSGCNLNPEKVAAFREIMEYVTAKSIPFYITARDESGEETLICGKNPFTGAQVQNPHFRQTLPELLK